MLGNLLPNAYVCRIITIIIKINVGDKANIFSKHLRIRAHCLNIAVDLDGISSLI